MKTIRRWLGTMLVLFSLLLFLAPLICVAWFFVAFVTCNWHRMLWSVVCLVVAAIVLELVEGATR